MTSFFWILRFASEWRFFFMHTRIETNCDGQKNAWTQAFSYLFKHKTKRIESWHFSFLNKLFPDKFTIQKERFYRVFFKTSFDSFLIFKKKASGVWIIPFFVYNNQSKVVFLSKNLKILFKMKNFLDISSLNFIMSNRIQFWVYY